MKPTITYLSLILLGLPTILNSCATGKNSVDISDAAKSTNTEKTYCYVVLRDGNVKYFSTLKLVTGIFKSPRLIADGETEILPAEIKEYKDANYHAFAQNQFYTKVKTHVATDVLPGFAVREISGNVNVYSIQFFNGSNIYKKYFLQKGTMGKINPYTPQLLKEYANNNVEAKNLLAKKKNKPKQIFAIVNNYNKTVNTLTTTYSNNDEKTGM